MKLLLCRECGDVVRLYPKVWRSCACGTSKGRYLEDNSTVEQSAGSLSIALDNHGLRDAITVWDQSAAAWHPLMVFRAFLNPTCEADVRWIEPAPGADPESGSDPGPGAGSGPAPAPEPEPEPAGAGVTPPHE